MPRLTPADAEDLARRALAAAGCQWAQGWLFSAAVPGPRLPEVLARLEADAVPLDAVAAAR